MENTTTPKLPREIEELFDEIGFADVEISNTVQPLQYRKKQRAIAARNIVTLARAIEDSKNKTLSHVILDITLGDFIGTPGGWQEVVRREFLNFQMPNLLDFILEATEVHPLVGFAFRILVVCHS